MVFKDYYPTLGIGRDTNPELAGLVADLLEEVERLRTRMRRAGLSPV